MSNLICPQCRKVLSMREEGYFCSECSARYPIIEGIPSFVSHPDTVIGFKKEYFQCLRHIENTEHYWHVSRKDLILHFLKKYFQYKKSDIHSLKMLELGCGNGSILHHLERNGIDIEGADIFLEGLKLCRQITNAPLYHLDARHLPFLENYDIIGAFDMLEHIQNDSEVLQEIRRSLKPEGIIIVTVPASQALWSNFDDMAHHYRRYSQKILIELFEQNGFQIEYISCFFFFLFPAKYLFRLVRNLFKLPQRNLDEYTELKLIPIFNSFALALMKIEKVLMSHISLPLGSSLIAIAKKS